MVEVAAAKQEVKNSEIRDVNWVDCSYHNVLHYPTHADFCVPVQHSDRMLKDEAKQCPLLWQMTVRFGPVFCALSILIGRPEHTPCNKFELIAKF
jgi:hypothetical protein